MAARKKTLTVAERHEQELEALRTQYQQKLDAANDLISRLEAERADQYRTHKKASFWQGGFLVGAPSIIAGITLGALITFSAVVQTLPIAYEQVARTALFSQVAAENSARAGETTTE